MSAPVPARMGTLLARIGFGIVQAVILVFCFAPPVLIIVLSFFQDVFSNFPPRHPTLDLYRELFAQEKWRDALLYSVRLAVPTALLTMLITAPAVLALERGRVRGRGALEFVALLPLLMPATGFAIALYVIYLKLGWTERFWPMVLVQSVVSAPIGFLIIRATLRRIPRHLDFAAMSLGASRGRALWDVSANLLRPAILAGGMFSVVQVFDDALYVTFLGGPDTVTLSKAIYDSIEFVLEPVVAALSATFTVFTTLLTLTVTGVRRRVDGVGR